MNEISNVNNMPSSASIKQIYVNTKDGGSVVRVSFNPHSSMTSKMSAGANGSGVMINIGTKNLNTNADISQAINSAVYSASNFNANSMVNEATSNIIKQSHEAVMAASTNVPNEEVLGLLS